MEFRDDLEWIDYDAIGFNIHVGPFFIASVGGGVYRMHLMIEPRHLNQGGVVHGGVSMTLADNAMGMAARVERRTPDVCFMTGELWSGGRKTAIASGVWKYLHPKTA